MIANPPEQVFPFLYELQILGYPKDPVRYPVLSGGAYRD